MDTQIANIVDTPGKICAQTFDVSSDFFVPELGLIIEADGVYGHLSKRDTYRDSEIMRVFGIENILHIKDTTKQGIKDTLWQALNNLTNK